jgi:hypothetical protein
MCEVGVLIFMAMDLICYTHQANVSKELLCISSAQKAQLSEELLCILRASPYSAVEWPVHYVLDEVYYV